MQPCAMTNFLGFGAKTSAVDSELARAMSHNIVVQIPDIAASLNNQCVQFSKDSNDLPLDVAIW